MNFHFSKRTPDDTISKQTSQKHHSAWTRPPIPIDSKLKKGWKPLLSHRGSGKKKTGSDQTESDAQVHNGAGKQGKCTGGWWNAESDVGVEIDGRGHGGRSVDHRVLAGEDDFAGRSRRHLHFCGFVRFARSPADGLRLRVQFRRESDSIDCPTLERDRCECERMRRGLEQGTGSPLWRRKTNSVSH